MGRKREFKGHKEFKLTHYGTGWAIYEKRCTNKKRNIWDWVGIKYPYSLKHAIEGLIELHIDPKAEMHFSLTYPNNFKPTDYPIQVPLNVDVESLQAIPKEFERIRDDLVAKMEQILDA